MFFFFLVNRLLHCTRSLMTASDKQLADVTDSSTRLQSCECERMRTHSESADAIITGDKASGSHSTHRDRGIFCASLSGVRIEEDVPAAPLTVLIDDETDLAGLQLR